jgi:hypothetical protein
MNKQYICAVGDSTIYGQELVMEHYSSIFAHLYPEDPWKLDVTYIDDEVLRHQYETLLDSLRFSSIVASELSMGHYNFARPGSSQEAIKMQTYLLLQQLEHDSVQLDSTVWIVGLTAPHRMMFIDEVDLCFDINATRFKYPGIEWGTQASVSFFADRKEQAKGKYTELFTKEMLSHISFTSIFVSWLMHINDTVNLLKSKGVTKIFVVNMFSGQFMDFRSPHNNLPSSTVKLVTELSLPFASLTIPGPTTDFRMVNGNHLPENLCPGKHFNKHPHRYIANYIKNEMTKRNY